MSKLDSSKLFLVGNPDFWHTIDSITFYPYRSFNTGQCHKAALEKSGFGFRFRSFPITTDAHPGHSRFLMN